MAAARGARPEIAGPGGLVLLTGAGGYLGTRLAATLLERGCEVLLWLHARDRAGADCIRARLEAQLGQLAARAHWAHGDLRDPRPFAGIDRQRIVALVHGAAVTRFNVEAELAAGVNVEGARRAFAFAGTCPRIERVILLGSVYAAGLRRGRVEERPLDDATGFANHYEWSRWAAEQTLLTGPAALPGTVCRIATVIADDESGRVGQLNAVHNTLRLLFYGLTSVLPGERATLLHFTTAERVCEAVVAALDRRAATGIVHVCEGDAGALDLGSLLDLAMQRFGRDADFARRRVLAPLLCDARSFGLLHQGLAGLAGDALRQGIDSVAPFAAQLFASKSFATDRLAGLLPGWRPASMRGVLERMLDDLVERRWGIRDARPV